MKNSDEAKITEENAQDASMGADCDSARFMGDRATNERFGLSLGRHKSWGMLLRAHARATARVGARMEAEGGLPVDWYDVLLVLECAPQGRLRMGELVEHVTLSRSGLTRLVDRIEAAGLVERQLSPGDRRAFDAILTAKGREAREKSWPLYARAIAEGFGVRYSEAEASQLATLLERQLRDEHTGQD